MLQGCFLFLAGVSLGTTLWWLGNPHEEVGRHLAYHTPLGERLGKWLFASDQDRRLLVLGQQTANILVPPWESGQLSSGNPKDADPAPPSTQDDSLAPPHQGAVLQRQRAGTELAINSLSALEQELVERLNQARKENQLPALAVEARLVEVARQRSTDMVQRDYFAHYSPTGETAFYLLETRGVAYRYAAENLARNTAPDELAASVAINALMASPPHRANNVSPNYQQVGVGLAEGPDGWKVFTIIFTGGP